MKIGQKLTNCERRKKIDVYSVEPPSSAQTLPIAGPWRRIASAEYILDLSIRKQFVKAHW